MKLGFFTILALLLVGLKLTGFIQIGWLAVALIFLVPGILILLSGVIAAIIVGLVFMYIIIGAISNGL